MKVLLINGSPHENGCTYTALSEIQKTLKEEGVEADIFWIGNKPISGCISCGSCRKFGKCAINDRVNEFIAVARDYDGYIFGSPVHYAAAGGAIASFMDRAFYTSSRKFRLKPAAAIVSARRGGTTAALDQLNKYFLFSQMPVISSRYWNMVHGNTPEEVRADEEGMQIMRTLARNMAWFLKCKDAADKAGIKLPAEEQRISTNYIH